MSCLSASDSTAISLVKKIASFLVFMLILIVGNDVCFRLFWIITRILGGIVYPEPNTLYSIAATILDICYLYPAIKALFKTFYNFLGLDIQP